MPGEMRLVVGTPDLPTKAWGDLGNLGNLKRGLLDLWTEERNTLAKAVMTDIEAQRKQRQEAR